MLELAVINNEPEAAAEHLSQALPLVRASWEPQTTENNLTLIAESRQKRDEDTSWLTEIIEALQKKRSEMS